jgi:succinate dehydrogenase flavin-adding protein (antitoxin of CptAB toxin-antitoxin module)
MSDAKLRWQCRRGMRELDILLKRKSRLSANFWRFPIPI